MFTFAGNSTNRKGYTLVIEDGTPRIYSSDKFRFIADRRWIVCKNCGEMPRLKWAVITVTAYCPNCKIEETIDFVTFPNIQTKPTLIKLGG